MLTDSQSKPNNAPVLEFKSGSFSVPALILSGNDFHLIEQQLEEKIKLAPEFFKNSPVIIELKELNKQNLEIEIADIVALAQKHGLLPIGIRGGTAQQNNAALELRLPVYTLSSRGHGAVSAQNSMNPIKGQQALNQVSHEKTEKRDNQSTTIISQPVRSGQRIYAHGDLVVLGQVSAGAEILAEGNIHIYGSLRGRALAGVQGNTDARIFCTNLQAELVSIAGNYKISEDLNKTIYNKPVHIYLKDYTLIIKEL